MNSLIKSFLLTILVVTGLGCIFIINVIGNQLKNTEKIKESMANGTIEHDALCCQDILNVLQVIKIEQQKFFIHIKLDPIKKYIEVKNIPISKKVTYHSKEYTLESLYDYSGVKSLRKVLQEQLSLPIDKYIVIKNEEVLESVIDCFGTIEYDTKKLSQLNFGESDEMYTDGYQLIDYYRFMKIMNGLKNQPDRQVRALEILIKEFLLQKAQIIKSDLSETVLKELVNNVETNLSASDFFKVKSIFKCLA